MSHLHWQRGLIPEIDGQDSQIVAEINITPLTDIFLVLLIIFMVTSSAMIEAAGKVNLPRAAVTQSEPRGTTITLTPNNEIYVNDKQVTEDQLEEVLRQMFNSRQDKLVIFRGDEDVSLGKAVGIISTAKKAGALEISIAAEAKKGQTNVR